MTVFHGKTKKESVGNVLNPKNTFFFSMFMVEYENKKQGNR